MPIGIILMMIARIYLRSGLSKGALVSTRPRNSHAISRHSITSVLSTVATCTAMVKVRFSSPSIPKRALAMVRWPLLLTGRYSVKPCSNPMRRACNSVMLINFLVSGLYLRKVKVFKSFIDSVLGRNGIIPHHLAYLPCGT